MGGMYHNEVRLIISEKKLVGIRGMHELIFLHESKVPKISKFIVE